MRRDDAIGPAESETVVPLPVDLQPLHAELEQSGVRARLMLHGRTQPTRYFVIDLRARLLDDYAAGEATGDPSDHVITAPSPVRRTHLEMRRQPSAPAAPTVIAQAAAPAGPTVVFDARLALFAAAIASAALILGAIGSGVIPH